MSKTPRAWTVGLLAQELGVPLSRIQYVLSTRRHIQPIGRAGNTRIYRSEAVTQIRHELNAIDARRAGGEA